MPVMIKLNPLLSGRLVLPETGPRDCHSAISIFQYDLKRAIRDLSANIHSKETAEPSAARDTQVHRPCEVEPTGLPIRGAISIGSQHTVDVALVKNDSGR